VWLAIVAVLVITIAAANQPFETARAAEAPRVLSLSPAFGPVSAAISSRFTARTS